MKQDWNAIFYMNAISLLVAFDSEMRTSYLWEKSNSKSLFQAIIISSEGDTVWRLVVNNYLVSWDTQGREKTF